MAHFVLALLLVACNVDDVGQRQDAFHAPRSCAERFDVTDYGAVQWHESTLAIRAALADAAECPEGGLVYLPGFFLVSWQPGQWLGVLAPAAKTTIQGPGIGLGGLVLSGGPLAGDRYTVFLHHADDVTLRDMTINGSRAEMAGSDEQTHSVVIWGSKRARLERVEFVDSYGDGIKAFGDETTSSFTVDSCVFDDQGRSGITLQSGLEDVNVFDSTFVCPDDQCLDMEPTGAGGIARTQIRGNRFVGSGISVTLTGTADPAEVRFVDNIVFGTVFAINIEDSIIANNTIIGASTLAPLSLRYSADRVLVQGNQLVSFNADALNIHARDTRQASHVRVSGNMMVVNNYPTAITVVSARDLTIENNSIIGASTWGILFQSLYDGLETARYVIRDNDVRGNSHAVVALGPRSTPFANILVATNTSMGTVTVWQDDGVVTGLTESNNVVW